MIELVFLRFIYNVGLINYMNLYELIASGKLLL